MFSLVVLDPSLLIDMNFLYFPFADAECISA
jgi:hypothetical protein